MTSLILFSVAFLSMPLPAMENCRDSLDTAGLQEVSTLKDQMLGPILADCEESNAEELEAARALAANQVQELINSVYDMRTSGDHCDADKTRLGRSESILRGILQLLPDIKFGCELNLESGLLASLPDIVGQRVFRSERCREDGPNAAMFIKRSLGRTVVGLITGPSYYVHVCNRAFEENTSVETRSRAIIHEAAHFFDPAHQSAQAVRQGETYFSRSKRPARSHELDWFEIADTYSNWARYGIRFESACGN